MWTRAELKARGKIAFRANYWRTVLVAFIATIITTGTSTVKFNGDAKDVLTGDYQMNLTDSVTGDLAVLGIVGGISLLVIIFALAISIFLINPLEVGCANFFISNRRNSATNIDKLERGFKPNYMNIVKVQFMTNLSVFLWSLLFVIPGVYKAYQYRLVSYILAEDPDMDYKEAMLLSKQAMEGHKMATFVLDLSFIGWELLGALTFGILSLLYVNPYVQATNAELYIKLVHPSEAGELNSDYVQAKTVEFTVEEN